MESSYRFETLPELDENPRLLLRKFAWIGLLCVAALVTLATYGIYRVYNWRLVESAHAEAQAVCQVILVKEKRQMLKTDERGQMVLYLPDSEKEKFERRLEQYLKPYDVDLVRIRDLQNRLVFEGGRAVREQMKSDSAVLRQALVGKGLSRLEKTSSPDISDAPRAPSGEQMVSYLPIWGRNQSMLGTIEIRRNIAGFRAQILSGVTFSGLLLTIVLLTLFGCVYLLVKQGAERLARAQDALRTLAATDPLTGVCNRREALARAAESFSRQRDKGALAMPENFSVLMLDFDNFKTINDRYGHLAGDEVLREMVVRIKAELRCRDIVGRYGGEEFLVVLPGTGQQACRTIAERLCRVVRERPFEMGDLKVSGSVSIGGAFARPFDRDVTMVLQRADECLYRAKALGKDCVLWAGGEAANGATCDPTGVQPAR